MASLQEKFDLIIRCCRVATEIKSRGGLMHEHQPEIKLVIETSNDDVIPITTTIQLDFPAGKSSEANNWSGYGKTLDDAFNSNLLCLFFELQERQEKIVQALKALEPLVFEAFPRSATAS